MIQFVDVSKKFQRKTVLENINLTIQQGEFVYIVGPSGAGKSTLIQLLYRQLLPSKGIIWVNQFDLTKMKAKGVPYLRRELGIVFQDFKLLPKLTVFENVAYAMAVTEKKPALIRRRVLEVLKEMGLANLRHRFPSELSGGEQQRVAIARAIVNRPSIVIADEPTGNLDPETAAGIINIFEAIHRQGSTVIMATHNHELVDRRPHRVVEIVAGQIVRDQAKGAYHYAGIRH
ncbi:cell-division associated ABC transporter, ATP binding FtsE subunit [Agrilactobacillus composti DSM 18527 = JCM 14202]|uniref:Cell division ATP-binding protein FtsE n=1 Tax=Agrilactobacillus composti DSM 18527 = JCM 14202 TaxID=1423734 RepID=A0A0R1XT06_9LACO|nr:cell division ATP-binding protein FtsE [Agrilactobacillus composti]KRM31147.1 cell-division associated ABC transporter, ATP binding FtsE subunit [Agrilactobacillus composti DSM 18527 = JCM 14202]